MLRLSQNYVRENNGPFMNEKITEELMDCTRLRTKFLKNRSPENRFLYDQQRKLCLLLVINTT